jgi:hypothetical protein
VGDRSKVSCKCAAATELVRVADDPCRALTLRQRGFCLDEEAPSRARELHAANHEIMFPSIPVIRKEES